MDEFSFRNNLTAKNNFCFFDTSLTDKTNQKSFLFTDPVDILTTNKTLEVSKILKTIEKARRKYYLAGFLSYELASFVEPSIGENNLCGFPLLWFGVYKKPSIIENTSKLNYRNKEFSYFTSEHKPNITDVQYLERIKKIKDYIRKGQTYQINFTYKNKFKFFGNALDFYLNVRKRQPTSYSAFINFGDSSILCFSPELFFKKTGDYIYTRPMKGTIEKGKNRLQQKHNISFLKKSKKDKSENIMIVDLIRNDLGRIALNETVKTYDLFRVERYRSILQMTSSIRARLNKDISFLQLVKSIFPSGSVTGAPKVSSMRFIKSLENEPRKIYTGSIGFITPKNNSCFNVAIRTVLIDKKENNAEVGIGSGIVYDSNPKRELKECRLKAKFLTDIVQPEFKLIETIFFSQKDGYYLLKYHLNRLSKSAKFFSYFFDRHNIRKKLDDFASRIGSKEDLFKVRLLLSKQGNVSLEDYKIKISNKPRYVRISTDRIDKDNIFVYHKTTNRSFYDNGLKKARKSGLFDFIYLNNNEEVCESSIGNLVIKKGSSFFTPPLSCGILCGVYREFLLRESSLSRKIIEKVISAQDLVNCDKIFIINSVIKMQEVKLLTK